MSRKLRVLALIDASVDARALEAELRKGGAPLSLRQLSVRKELAQALREDPPELVLAGVADGDNDGKTVLELVRKESPETPLIFLVGNIGAGAAVELIKSGAADVVPRGELARLLPAVETALREAEQRWQQKRAEEAMRRGESRFRAVFEGAGTGIAVEDLNGRILETNRALQQMLGYSAEELLALTRKEITHSRDTQVETGHFKKLLSGEADSYQAEKRFVRKDGRIIWGRLTITMIRDEKAAALFPVVMIEDITASRQAEQAVQQYSSIVQFSNDAIITKTFDGIILSWNPAAERLYGYTAAESNGRSISMILPPEKEAEFMDLLEKVRRGEHVGNFETTRIRKDGSKVDVSISTSAMQDATGRVIGVSSISRDITGRRQAEEALRRSEAQLARSQRIAHLGSWEQDLATGTLEWSSQTFRIFGAKPDEFKATVEEFYGRVHPEDRELVRGKMRESIAHRSHYNVDHRIVLPGGEIRTVNEQAELLCDESGKAIRLVGTALDITERKKSERVISGLSNLGQRLSSATTAKDAAQIIVDVADKLLGWDACSLDLCSSDRETVTAVLNVDMIDGCRQEVSSTYVNDRPSPRMRRIMQRGAELIKRGDPKKPDGDHIPFGDTARTSESMMYVPVRNGTNIIGVLSIHSYTPNAYTGDDLKTLQSLADHCGGALERIRAESENKKLAAFPQFNPNPVIELAADARLQYFNGAALEMAKSLGFSHPSEMLPETTPGIVKECLATGRSRLRLETVIQNRNISWSFFPVKTIGVVHCYAGDVTERQHLETQLRHSQKMESVGQLAGGIAHDFNNILTVILGHTSLLALAPKLPPEAADSAHQIGLAAERAANLTRQLLTFSRRQVIQPKNLDLNELVNNMTKMLRRLLGEDIILKVSVEPNLPLIHADPGMIEQVLMNLSVNARDAMPKGGTLFMETSVTSIDTSYVRRVPEAHVGQHVCLTVRDTGAGIAAEHLPRIFEPFFTTKDIGKGTGLGLATVYGVVQQHRGWIKVSSKLKEGSVFQVFLPAVPAKVEVADSKSVQPRIRGGTETILVVEDETALRGLVKSVLERYGYRVLEAESGVDALPVWLEHRDSIHLLLTDLVMPYGVSGKELAQRLRGDKPELKVIFSSGYSLAVVGADMMLKDGLNFLQKPYHPRRLAQAVRDCLDSD